MNKFNQSLLAGTALLASFLPGVVSALPLTIDFAVQLSHDSGPGDFAGMDGATVAFSGTFDDGATWTDLGFGEFGADFSSHSFTVSGATDPLANGVYSDPDGLSLDCLFGECVLIDFSTFDFPLITLGNGLEFELGFSLTPGVEPNGGDFIDASHFGSSFTGQSTITDKNPGNANIYAISQIPTNPMTTGGPTDPNVGGGTTPPVPEPATLALLGLGLFGMRFARRK